MQEYEATGDQPSIDSGEIAKPNKSIYYENSKATVVI